ncbi:two-component regulator propeller domain-containing protein [Flavobacterium piscis]|uniref:histidine kinase n=1 Tax=Flavobacterium piscis TaxID=1114874 RepID=A0ABU1YBS9_9FLAO|nr:two-component regulator propeller domain-containing protein [Flavobacterium piscis]MDR7211703.1 signal transduction histidine kinase/ligand-binding sensor domain-containing protein/DNA-binding response OmpR family regulator [Flavobacterium piscis]
MRLNPFTLFLCLIMFYYSNSQNIKFTHYNDNNGLSHNSVRHIVQDKKGFLWFGTFSGLNRFDGYQFKNYMSSSPGINKLYNDDITALELDEESNHLWIGTRKGLTLFKMDTQVFVTFLQQKNNPNSLPEEEIRSVHVDKFKRVWVGTKNQGAYMFFLKENRFEKIPIKGFDYVKEIFEDKKGNIWVGSYDKGSVAKITLDSKGAIVKMNNYTLTVPNSNVKNPYINFIYEDAKSDIFIGTREGLYKLDKKNDSFTNLYIENKEIRGSLGPYFLSVAQAPDGKYWVGTLGGLLVCKQLEDIQEGNYKWYYSILSDNTSIVDNLVSALYFDASGVLWIGTEDGLDKYDPYENQFTLNKDISRYIGNQAPRIRGFSKTYDGKVIVVTNHNGLFISSSNGFIPLHNKAKDIASIYSDDGKIFYCGLWNGNVLVYNYTANTSKEIKAGFETSPVFAFNKIGDQSMMVGSFGEGAVILNTKTLVIETSKGKLLPGFQINAIEKDTKNNVWFATETGVVRFNNVSGKIETYKTFSKKENMVPHEDNVSDIMADKKGKIWASTRFGLCQYDAVKNKFITITNFKELSGKWITDMLSDANGDLWLNINNNSIAWVKSDLKDINVYHVNSGNRLDVFSSGGFFNFNSNIYLGGKNGIISFSPQTMKRNKWAPVPVITEFKIQNEEVFPEMEINGQVPLLKDLNYGKKVELNYKNRNFSLQFSTPSFANEKLNKFQYMLEGFDKEWITENSNSRTVQYTNLYPGSYVFKIKSSNSDGHWSKVVSYQIKILPPFWLTPISFLLVFLLLGFIFYFIRREIKNRIRLKQELLTEKVNREHDIKLNNEKLRFFTNISHELRTPLTLILGPAKQLLDESNNATDYEKSRYNLIYQNASRLLNLVNQVLDFRKAQSGELKLKVSKTDILTYSKNIFESFKEMAYNKKIKLNFIAEAENITGWVDNDKYDKILYNLLSNALKFTNKYGNVDLLIRLKNTTEEILIIEVSDDGIGIPLKSQEKIFKRFYQATNSKAHNTGSGIGLSLVKSLVALHKGAITVESTLGKGSTFRVEIPIDRISYESKEVFEYALKNDNLSMLIPEKAAKKTIQNTELKQKILVIEDNSELRKYLVDFLSDYYKVYDAENGEEGLKICRQIKPILCVADVMMPVMDGLEFCKELKNDEFISHIPVVLLTALGENVDKVKGYETGADGYLVKPFEPSLLKTVIENIIKSRLELKVKFSGEVESKISLLTHSPIDEEFMEKITNLINDNLSEEDLSTEFLCDKLGVSSSKLYRKIKELTDLAPNEFIRTIRLKKSAELLKTKKYNVSEVTDLVGFNDPLYFSRCFKKQFGFPPSKLIN